MRHLYYLGEGKLWTTRLSNEKKICEFMSYFYVSSS